MTAERWTDPTFPVSLLETSNCFFDYLRTLIRGSSNKFLVCPTLHLAMEEPSWLPRLPKYPAKSKRLPVRKTVHYYAEVFLLCPHCCCALAILGGKYLSKPGNWVCTQGTKTMPVINHAFARVTPAIFVIFIVFTGSEKQSPYFTG